MRLEEELTCPVTQKLLEEPVTLDSGHTLSFTAAAQRLVKVADALVCIFNVCVLY